ncbi:MAG: c-type cytochrome [Bryobacterales bacterium]|nr:c-type cytochrome [Bryobacterales bacterium]
MIRRNRYLLIWLLGGLAAAQEESSTRIANPFTSDDDRAAGAKLYQSQCASCHGLDGKGGQGTPDFTSGQFRRASSDEGLFQIVAKGISGTTMPAFNLDGKQIWQTVAHIRSFSFRRTAAASSGDTGKGRELFRLHKCAACHESSAPELTRVGRNRPAAELRRAMEEPDAEVDSAWWRVAITLRGGQSLEGRRLNEDTYTIQLLDRQGNLRSADKSDVAQTKLVRTSPMPSYRGKLREQEWNDLLAYLISGDLR